VRRLLTAMAALALGAVVVPQVGASGPLSIYGIVEKVVFEPSERAAERIQVWGVFSYAHVKFFNRKDGDPSPVVSKVERGYLYFRLPSGGEPVATVRTEWSDLKAIAGTGQAVGFGGWAHTGRFELLRANARDTSAAVLERAAGGERETDLRIRTSSEPRANPAAYQTNAGIVKLSATGSHAAIVQQLQAALPK
jgi:hypothetical protein